MFRYSHSKYVSQPNDMAFVPAPCAALRSNSFMGVSITAAAPPRLSTVRMGDEQRTLPPDSDTPIFGKSGKSLWKENLFTGGFPGGEMFFRTWLDEGMMRDVPDLPDSLQPRTAHKPKKKKKSGGILEKLDATEFFKDFIGMGSSDDEGDDDEGDDDEGGDDEGGDDYAGKKNVKKGKGATRRKDSKAPNESLFSSYFPARTRNLAPDIRIVYEKSFENDYVSMAMKEVKPSPIDVYFPKNLKGKAPIIEMFYNGSMKSAYVSVRFDAVEGLPTLPPPPKQGEAVSKLVPGRGGGLRLKYLVEGEGELNI